MKVAVTKGLNVTENPFSTKNLVVRTEKTGNFSTLSIADEDAEVMLQIVVDEPIKKMLKEIVK